MPAPQRALSLLEGGERTNDGSKDAKQRKKPDFLLKRKGESTVILGLREGIMEAAEGARGLPQSQTAL